jgi:two-component system response regulator FlrC
MKHAPVRLSADAQACLIDYAWPGNVRELDNAIQRALILQQGGTIRGEDFCLAGPIGSVHLPPVGVPALLRAPNVSIPTSHPGAEPDAASGLGDDLRRREFEVIIETLRSERGRRKEAAERLGISPRTLRYKLAQMRDAGMDVEAYLFAS